MAAKPWNNVPLVLPINGTDYEIQPIGYDDGLTLITLSKDEPTPKSDPDTDGVTESPDAGDGEPPKVEPKKVDADDSEEELFKLCTGEAWGRMEADNVPYPARFRASVAALVYQQCLVLADMSNEDAVAAGEKAWEVGVSPEAVAVALAAANPTSDSPKASTDSPTGSTNSTSSGSAKKTPSRASTRPTTSPKTTPRTRSAKPAKKAAPRSRRTPSSSTST